MHILKAPAALLAPFRLLAVHSALVAELTRREVNGRYRGANLGLFWSLVSPFLFLGIYAIAFGTVMGGRWPEAQASGTPFSIVLFAGMIPYFVLSECMTRSPELVVGNPAYVKRVVFPLELLPWPMLFSILFHSAMNVLVFLAMRLAMEGQMAWTVVYLPFVIIPIAILGLGVSWFLASISVYFRDVRQVVGLASMSLLFLSSVMVPMAAVPERYRMIFMLNPVSFIAEQARAILIWGQAPDWMGLLGYTMVALAFMYAGYAWFMATKRGFADVL
ncbi:ABC transporter permease [Thermomonas sp.]|uniref:ABC transporter permease n=1 Tax=Thermomonas sp. TaxID=1971895 RepID=UPI00391BE45A